jgi:hypothetical protein
MELPPLLGVKYLTDPAAPPPSPGSRFPGTCALSRGGGASVHVGGDVGPSPRRASGAQKSYFGQIGRLIVYAICSLFLFAPPYRLVCVHLFPSSR